MVISIVVMATSWIRRIENSINYVDMLTLLPVLRSPFSWPVWLLTPSFAWTHGFSHGKEGIAEHKVEKWRGHTSYSLIWLVESDGLKVRDRVNVISHPLIEWNRRLWLDRLRLRFHPVVILLELWAEETKVVLNNPILPDGSRFGYSSDNITGSIFGRREWLRTWIMTSFWFPH
jgi:hypothetical protein